MPKMPTLFDFATTPIARDPHVQFREVGEEIYLVHNETDQIFNLNPTSAAIWRLLETPQSGHEVAEILSAAFPVIAPARIREDVNNLLNQLVELGFVKPAV